MAWSIEALTIIGFDDDASEGDVVTVRIASPIGVIAIMGALDIEARTLIVRRAHMQSEGGANAVGLKTSKILKRLRSSTSCRSFPVRL